MKKNQTLLLALLTASAAIASPVPDIPDCIEIDDGECKTVTIPHGAAPLGGEWADSSSQFPPLSPRVMDEDPGAYSDDFMGSGFFDPASPGTVTGTVCNDNGDIGAYAPDSQPETDDTDACLEIYLDIPFYYFGYEPDLGMFIWITDYVKKGPVTVCPIGGCP